MIAVTKFLRVCKIIRFLVLNYFVIVNCSRINDASYENCDYYQQLQPNQTYDIFSPGYGNPIEYNLPRNTSCRWTAVAPKSHNILLSCIDINLQKSNNCEDERLEVSERGMLSLLDAKKFCGNGRMEYQSINNKMVVALKTSLRRHHDDSKNVVESGYFRCTLNAVELPKAVTQYCQCGRKKQTRIVGGVETAINEFPMMAGLVDVNQQIVFCGATIIARTIAMSAAHCLSNRLIDDIALLVGDHDYNSRNDTTFAALYRLSQTISHPLYATTNDHYDIALLRTQRPIIFNEAVGTACLPFKYAYYGDSFANDTVTATGWGSFEFGGPLSTKLQKVQLNVISNEKCSRSYRELTASQICTFRRDKDTCQSDSGGPLLYTDPNNNLQYLVGIVSLGLGCASDTPSVNTRVTSYLGWLQMVTPEVLYCYK